MVTRFADYARTIVRAAETEAAAAGSPVIEAEHMLLALAAAEGTQAQQVLASAGLDHEAISGALERERRASLAAAGVALPPGGLPPASHDPGRHPRLGASSKLVLERALRASAGRGRIQPGHLLLGVLGAQAGTVPRALALAGVDPADLAARTRRALAADPGPGDDS